MTDDKPKSESEFQDKCNLVKRVIAESPDYLQGKRWYARDEIVEALKKMKYCEEIAQELADWYLRHIRHAFDRGVFSAINHLYIRLQETEKLRAEVERLEAQLEQFKVCNTCLGEPINDKPCICGGSGRASDELAGLRGELTREQCSNADLKVRLNNANNTIDRLKEYGR